MRVIKSTAVMVLSAVLALSLIVQGTGVQAASWTIEADADGLSSYSADSEKLFNIERMVPGDEPDSQITVIIMSP